jgi:Aspartyl protease
MKKFNFVLDDDDKIIILIGKANGHEIQMALDTAASHSVIDFNILMIMGYSPNSATGQTFLETSNGVITADLYPLKSLEMLGKKVTSFEITSYDFLEKSILSPYQGVLGLDFFDQTILTIDFINSQVWLQESEN